MIAARHAAMYRLEHCGCQTTTCVEQLHEMQPGHQCVTVLTDHIMTVSVTHTPVILSLTGRSHAANMCVLAYLPFFEYPYTSPTGNCKLARSDLLLQRNTCVLVAHTTEIRQPKAASLSITTYQLLPERTNWPDNDCCLTAHGRRRPTCMGAESGLMTHQDAIR